MLYVWGGVAANAAERFVCPASNNGHPFFGARLSEAGSANQVRCSNTAMEMDCFYYHGGLKGAGGENQATAPTTYYGAPTETYNKIYASLTPELHYCGDLLSPQNSSNWKGDSSFGNSQDCGNWVGTGMARDCAISSAGRCVKHNGTVELHVKGNSYNCQTKHYTKDNCFQCWQKYNSE